MLTYQMNFKAKIESINIHNKQMVVEYFDPHGHANIRLAISFKFNSSPEELRQLIIDSTPHTRFHAKNEEMTAIKENNIDYSDIEAMVDTSMEYELPKYDNEVI